MAIGQVIGAFSYNGQFTNGATAKLWSKAAFFTAVDSTATVQDNPMSNTQVTLTSSDGTKHTANTVIRVETEDMYVISIAGNVLTVQRGYNNTALAAHVLGTIIYNLSDDSPIFDDAEPGAGYQVGATITTGVAYGGYGAYRWIDVADGEYYVSCFYDSHRAWFYHEVESRYTVNQLLKVAGDVLARGTNVPERIPIGIAGQVLTAVAGLAAWATPSGEITVDEQIFTGNDTWTKPALKHFALVEVIGGGGGGGGGSTANIFGGAGGGGGGRNIKLIEMDSLGATEAVVIGAGGTGGIASTDGTNGGTSSFGTHVEATGGRFGKGLDGRTSSAGGGVGPATWQAAQDVKGSGGLGAGPGPAATEQDGVSAEYGGAGGGAGTSAQTGKKGGSSIWGGAGGGGGGGITGANRTGGAGGLSGTSAAGGGGAGGAAGGGAGDAGAAGDNVICGAGGGGGGGNDGAVGGIGGAGGISGGGGGGGGAGGGAGTGGAGGNGARGEVRVWSF